MAVTSALASLLIAAGLTLFLVEHHRNHVHEQLAVLAALPTPRLGVASRRRIAGPSLSPERVAAAVVSVTFTLPADGAIRQVALCGDFNDWQEDDTLMSRSATGDWEVAIDLGVGRSYRYRFLIDGQHWVNDPAPDLLVPNVFGSDDSMVVVGYQDRRANVVADREDRIPRSTDTADMQEVVSTNGHEVERTGYEALLHLDEFVEMDEAMINLTHRTDDFWAEVPLRTRLLPWPPHRHSRRQTSPDELSRRGS